MYSNHNNITGNRVNDNFDGIWCIGSNHNVFSDNTVNGNTNTSITFDYLCSDNTVSGNILAGNAKGIWINGSSNNNLIYNNYFNNNLNAGISADSTGSTWNVNPTPGTNIIGGSYIGGNAGLPHRETAGHRPTRTSAWDLPGPII